MEQENEKQSSPGASPAEQRPAKETGRAEDYDLPPSAVPVTQVRRAAGNGGEGGRRDAISADDRREFFSEAMREALAPLAGLLERKINPFLAALEAIPAEVERLTEVSLPAMERVLDQPLLGGGEAASARTISLPQNRRGGGGGAGAAQEYLRPPGAMAPGEFETICSRCAQCVAACPAQAIQLDAKHLVADGLPYIVAAHQPCVVCDELACMKSCPTGALLMVDRLKIKMGTARVDARQCLRDRGEDCRLCIEVCPITEAGGGVSPIGDAIFIHAETGRVRVRRNACIGCGLCESRCPTSPPAIRVEPFRATVDPIIA